MYDNIQPTSSRYSYIFCGDPKRFWIAVVSVISCAIIISLSVNLAQEKRGQFPSTSPRDFFATKEDVRCVASGYDEENPIFWCGCHGSMDEASDSLKEHASDLFSNLMPREDFEDLDGADTPRDCSSPRSQAFWWLVWYRKNKEQKTPLDDTLREEFFLAEFWMATNGQLWEEDGGWLEPIEACAWDGVDCNAAGRVETISIRNNNVGGVLPTNFEYLPHLRELSLVDNEIGQQIPDRLFDMDLLEILDLSSNYLSGFIPEFSESAIQFLNLKDNNLEGPVPDSISNLGMLIDLKLEENLLTGNIPTHIGRCTNLESLSLADNAELEGSIPSELVTMESLRELSLHDMGLTGELPEEIWVNTVLEHLRIDNNYISGSVPASVGGMKSMTYLDVRKNEFSGALPTELGQLTNLQQFSCSQNFFTGTVPTEMGRLNALENLHMSYTFLTGEMPGEICLLAMENASNLGTLMADCSSIECDCCTSEASDEACEAADDDYAQRMGPEGDEE